MDTVIRLIADGLVIPIVLIGAYVLLFHLPRGQRYRSYCRILLAGLTAYLVAKLVSTIYQPTTLRPFELLGVDPGAAYLNNPGFPSDHVLFCMAITLAVWFETKYKKLAAFLFGATVLVALGRISALVHTPLDVLGGFLIACAGIPWYLQRDNKLDHKLAKNRKNV
ncbi:MAG: phosphatase PAP2 family protein [Candidatus Saccharimonadales bacterium]